MAHLVLLGLEGLVTDDGGDRTVSGRVDRLVRPQGDFQAKCLTTEFAGVALPVCRGINVCAAVVFTCSGVEISVKFSSVPFKGRHGGEGLVADVALILARHHVLGDVVVEAGAVEQELPTDPAAVALLVSLEVFLQGLHGLKLLPAAATDAVRLVDVIPDVCDQAPRPPVPHPTH